MTPQDDTAPKRILWIAYVFPPEGGAQGSRMQQYLARLCQAHPDLSVDVLTIHQTELNTQFDPHLLNDIPASVRIHRVKPGTLYWLRYRWGLDRRYLMSADSRLGHVILSIVQLGNLGWIPRAALWLGRQGARRYDAIYVFVDPFASLALALLASILNPGARLVLEYGDPRILLVVSIPFSAGQPSASKSRHCVVAARPSSAAAWWRTRTVPRTDLFPRTGW